MKKKEKKEPEAKAKVFDPAKEIKKKRGEDKRSSKESVGRHNAPM